MAYLLIKNPWVSRATTTTTSTKTTTTTKSGQLKIVQN